MSPPRPAFHLPLELIVEILVRFPVRSLLRFKCVCKSWLSVIFDPNFAKSHYNLAAKPTHRILFKSTCGSQVQSIDIEASLLDVSNHILPNPFFRNSEIDDDDSFPVSYIYGSCRGFLLLGWKGGNLLVWNPTTGLAKLISYSHVNSKSMYDFLYGFGYDASTDDYLVILIAISDPGYRRSADWKTHIEIFSLKTNSWNQIEGFRFPYQMHVYGGEHGLFLNGALHWLVYSHDTEDRVIIAFDLVQMSLLEIPIPLDIAMEFKSGLRGYHLRVLGDCLCLCSPGDIHGDGAAEIWMMKKYKVHSSWTMSFVLLDNDFFPICSTKSEGLIGSDCDGGLLKYNNEGVLIEDTSFDSPDFRENSLEQTVVYRESLLSLPPS